MTSKLSSPSWLLHKQQKYNYKEAWHEDTVSLGIDLLNQYSDCICTKCKDSGCHVKLDRISNDHVVISGTQFQQKRSYDDEYGAEYSSPVIGPIWVTLRSISRVTSSKIDSPGSIASLNSRQVWNRSSGFFSSAFKMA